MMKDGWKARMYASLARRDSALSMGLVELGQRFHDEAVQAAYRAGISMSSLEFRSEQRVGLVQTMDMVARSVLLAPHVIPQSLWRYSLLL
jgi:hypothetical protein